MEAYMDGNEVHHFTIEDREWLNREKFADRAEDAIAWKLAESFTDEELHNLVKIDMKKVEKRVIEKIAERVVCKCLHDDRFFGKEE